MFSTAVTQSSPAFFTFLYSTRNDWMGKPRLPRGIQVTYADVSVAVETVGLSGASGATGEGKQRQIGQDKKHRSVIDKKTARAALTESLSFRRKKREMLVKRWLGWLK